MPTLNAERLDALWTDLSGRMSAIEAITFHPADARFPPTWAVAFEGQQMLMVDALPEPDRLVFSMGLGVVLPGERAATYETLLRANAWLATQVELAGGIVLHGDQVAIKVTQRLEHLDADGLCRIVRDLLGASHAWHYFRATQNLPADPLPVPSPLERV